MLPNCGRHGAHRGQAGPGCGGRRRRVGSGASAPLSQEAPGAVVASRNMAEDTTEGERSGDVSYARLYLAAEPKEVRMQFPWHAALSLMAFAHTSLMRTRSRGLASSVSAVRAAVVQPRHHGDGRAQDGGARRTVADHGGAWPTLPRPNAPQPCLFGKHASRRYRMTSSGQAASKSRNDQCR